MNRDHQAPPSTERAEPTSVIEASAHPSPISPANVSPRFNPRPSNGPEHSVDLHIEELVLHGFDPAQRYAIADAVERELTRLFSEQGFPIVAPEDVEIADLNNGAINLQSGSNDEAIGSQLARAIYGGLIQ